MPFSDEEKALIKNLHLFKEYGSQRRLSDFFFWGGTGIKTEHLTEKNSRETGNTDQRHESGRPKHTRTTENVTTMDELVPSQEGQTHTSFNTTNIQKKN